MEDKIRELLNVIENVNKQEVLDFFKDASVPLETRWELFSKVPDNLVNNESYYMRYKTLDSIYNREVSWFDDFYIEKHETVDMITFVKYKLEFNDTFNNAIKNDPLILDKFKEEILSTGVRSWILDW